MCKNDWYFFVHSRLKAFKERECDLKISSLCNYTQGHIVRRYTLIIFWESNVSDTYFGLIQPATNFYIWFGISMNQENEFERIPPYSMVLIIPGSGHIVWMIWVRQPTSASMEHLCSHLVWTLSCGPNFVAIFHNYILNNLWSLVWHNSDGKLANNLKK